MKKKRPEPILILRIQGRQLAAKQRVILALAAKHGWIQPIVEGSVLQTCNLSLPKKMGQKTVPNVSFQRVTSLGAVDAVTLPVHIYQVVVKDGTSRAKQARNENAVARHLIRTGTATDFRIYPSEKITREHHTIPELAQGTVVKDTFLTSIKSITNRI